MRLLAGHTSTNSFSFIPHSITSFGATVLVEGCDNTLSISWVHAWTVTHGIITHLREYFNTSLTVTRISSDSSESEIITTGSVWESTLSQRVGKSVPGLILTL
ncbi:Wound-induced protein Wun1-like [Sesbania bispinosa]|nr:Wound-induced protein Wun1-like [Sesbania bispinosa]